MIGNKMFMMSRVSESTFVSSSVHIYTHVHVHTYIVYVLMSYMY